MSIVNDIEKNQTRFYLYMWLCIFLYVVITALFIQVIALPYLFPSWHAGQGLLEGGDWIAYHNIAINVSERIQSEGWSVWELRPREQAPAGIAALIYTLTGIKQPWMFLPINAFLHASSALVLLLVVKKVTGSNKYAAWAIIPFVFFPTNMIWNASLHKDGFFIAGSLLFIYGFIQFAETNNTDKFKHIIRFKHILIGFPAIISGILLVWIVRPYGTEMLLYIAFFIAIPLTIFLITKLRHNQLLWLNIIILWISLFLLLPLTRTGVHHEYVKSNIEYAMGQYTGIIAANIQHEITQEKTDQSILSKRSTNGIQNNTEQRKWHTTPFIPEPVDDTLYTLSVMRNRYRELKPDAKSNVDVNVKFTSAGDIITYIPRALQIGLFSPFPNQWFERGKLGSTTLMRRVSAFEMVIIYFALFFSCFALWLWRKIVAIYITYGFTIGMILTYALVVVNVGTLHRMRYGFIMTLVAFGLAAMAFFIDQRKKLKKEVDSG